MEAIHIREAIARALQEGNWLVFHPHSSAGNKEFYFFYSQGEAREFALNNRDKNWAVTYIASKKHFFTAIKNNPQFFKQLFLKLFKMNQQNANYLKEQVKYMGFGEKLHADLEQKPAEGKPEFQLLFQTIVNQKPFEAVLNFRKPDNSDMYFFNSYTAKLEKNDNQSVEQTFYINKGKGVTAKEAFNLLDGRAVYKELTNKEEQPYNAWLQLDFKNKDKHGNYIVKQYHENYGYDLAKSLSSLPVKELQTDSRRMELVKSLEKGNLQAVTLEHNGRQQKIYLEANPQYKTINLYDGQMNRLKREDILPHPSKAAPLTNAKSQQENVEKLNGKEVHTAKGVKVKEQKDKVNKPEKEDSLLPRKRTGRKKGLTQ